MYYSKKINSSILLVTICICLLFCNKEKNVSVTFMEYRRNELQGFTSYSLKSEIIGNNHFYTYKKKDDYLQFIVDFNIMNNKYIRNKDTIELEHIASNVYTVSGKEYKIYNFLYFNIDYNDAANNFFIVKEYGVINILNTAFMNKILIEYDNLEIQKIISQLNAKLMNDTTFYLYDNQLPPLPLTPQNRNKASR